MAHVGNAILQPFPRDVYENGSVIEKGSGFAMVAFRVAKQKDSSKRVGLACVMRFSRTRGK